MKILNSDLIAPILERFKGKGDFPNLFKGIVWNLIGALSYQFSLLIGSILIARIINKEEFGQLGIIRSTINTFVVFSTFGIGLTASKYIAELKLLKPNKVGRILGLVNLFSLFSGGLFFLLIFVFSDSLSTYLFGDISLSLELAIGAIIIFFCTLNGTQVGVLTGFEKFKKLAKNNLIAACVNLPIQLILTWYLGLKGAIVSFGIAYLILVVLHYFTIKSECREHSITTDYKSAWRERGVLLKFSLPAFFSGAMVMPILWFGNMLLIKNPNGFEEMATFEAANQWRNVILFVPAMVSRVTLPLLAKNNNAHRKFSHLIKANVLLNLIFTLFIVLTLTLLSSQIMSLYGEDFILGNDVLIVLCFSAIFSALSSIMGQVLAGKGKMWIGFYFNVLWAFVFLSSGYFLVNNLGGVGLSITYFLSYLLHTIALMVYVNYKYGINSLDFRSLKDLI